MISTCTPLQLLYERTMLYSLGRCLEESREMHWKGLSSAKTRFC